MSDNTATKVPATHSGKVTAASRAYTRGLMAPNARDGYFKSGKGFAVDVQRDGSATYQAGVIVRFFNTRDEAAAFAASVNDGTVKGAWYTANNARNARVVPAYNVPRGKSAVDVLKAAAKRGNAKPQAPATTPATTPAALPAASA